MQVAIPALSEILKVKLPAQTALGLKRTVRSIHDALKDYEETRQKLVLDFAEKDENGDQVPGDEPNTIKIADMPKFVEEMNALTNAEVEIAAKTIPISAFGSAEVSAENLMFLEWLITEDE